MRKTSIFTLVAFCGGLILPANLFPGAEKVTSPVKTPSQDGKSTAVKPKVGSPLGMELQYRGKGLILVLTRPAKVAVYANGRKVHACKKTTECAIPDSVARGVDELTFLSTEGGRTVKKALSLKSFAHLFRKPGKAPAAPGAVKIQPRETAPRRAFPPLTAAPGLKREEAPFLNIEEVFLKDDLLYVRLKNTGNGPLGPSDAARGGLALNVGTKRHVLRLGSLKIRSLSPGESAELSTGVRMTKRAAVHASLLNLPGGKTRPAMLTPTAGDKEEQIQNRVGMLTRFHSQNPDKEFLFLDYPEESEGETRRGEPGKAGSIPLSKAFAQMKRAVPLPMGPQAHVLPGSAHGLRVTIEGGASVFHPGDEIRVNFEIENPESDGFASMGSDWWDYHTVLYLHDRSYDVDQMGLWQVPRHSLTTLSDDRRRGSFRVTVPYRLPERGAYVITILQNEDAYGHSGLFSVWPEGVAGRDVIVEQPNTRVRFARGSFQTIRWRYFERPSGGTGESDFHFIPRDRFIVEVLHAGGVVDRVPLEGLECESDSNRCSLGWIVPGTLPVDSGYRIRVRHSDVVSLGGEPPGDESNSDFDITEGARIRVDNPVEGRNVSLFGPLQISGYITGIERGSYNIRLLQYGSLAKVLREGHAPASRLFDVSPLLATSCEDSVFDNVLRAGSGSQYQIEVEYLENPEVRGVSGNFFIRRPTVEVTAPDGGETWRNGETRQIRWEFGDLNSSYLHAAASTLEILLERGGFMGTDVECIARNLPAVYDGSYSWTVGAGCDNRGASEGADLGSAPSATGSMGGVPDRVPPGSTFRVRIRSNQCPRIQGLSERDFSIAD